MNTTKYVVGWFRGLEAPTARSGQIARLRDRTRRLLSLAIAGALTLSNASQAQFTTENNPDGTVTLTKVGWDADLSLAIPGTIDGRKQWGRV